MTGVQTCALPIFWIIGSPILTAPIISDVNSTTSNIPFGDNESPYTTSDTTPTFSITTNISANCRIGDENQNYSTMDGSRNCGTTGSTNHICTLTAQDELITSSDEVYLGCENSGNNNQTSNATAKLIMDITDLESNATKLIQDGIENSVIWPGATVYSDQQVYLRDLSDNQVLATVDRVAVYGNQRWIFNYGNTSLGLFNITPVVYVLDMVNTPLGDIEEEVTALINATKN